MKKRQVTKRRAKQEVGTKELPTSFTLVELEDCFQVYLNELPLHGCAFRKRPESIETAKETLQLLMRMSEDPSFFAKCLNDPDRFVQLLAQKLKEF